MKQGRRRDVRFHDRGFQDHEAEKLVDAGRRSGAASGPATRAGRPIGSGIPHSRTAERDTSPSTAIPAGAQRRAGTYSADDLPQDHAFTDDLDAAVRRVGPGSAALWALSGIAVWGTAQGQFTTGYRLPSLRMKQGRQQDVRFHDREFQDHEAEMLVDAGRRSGAPSGPAVRAGRPVGSRSPRLADCGAGHIPLSRNPGRSEAESRDLLRWRLSVRLCFH